MYLLRYHNNDDSCYLMHHGIEGQKWYKKNGPPYPLDPEDHSAAEKKANNGVYSQGVHPDRADSNNTNNKQKAQNDGKSNKNEQNRQRDYYDDRYDRQRDYYDDRYDNNYYRQPQQPQYTAYELEQMRKKETTKKIAKGALITAGVLVGIGAVTVTAAGVAGGIAYKNRMPIHESLNNIKSNTIDQIGASKAAKDAISKYANEHGQDNADYLKDMITGEAKRSYLKDKREARDQLFYRYNPKAYAQKLARDAADDYTKEINKSVERLISANNGGAESEITEQDFRNIMSSPRLTNKYVNELWNVGEKKKVGNVNLAQKVQSSINNEARFKTNAKTNAQAYKQNNSLIGKTANKINKVNDTVRYISSPFTAVANTKNTVSNAGKAIAGLGAAIGIGAAVANKANNQKQQYRTGYNQQYNNYQPYDQNGNNYYNDDRRRKNDRR